MNLDDLIGDLNAHFFFQEFTYSKLTFRPKPGIELELADGLVWLDDLLIVYQFKQRAVSTIQSESSEISWFRRKVKQGATRQIRQTMAYLKQHSQIRLTNRRGYEFVLKTPDHEDVLKVVCYAEGENLPMKLRLLKFHESKTAGLIHLFPVNDYSAVLGTLITPHEFANYLSYREHLYSRWNHELNTVSEPALLSQYLADDWHSAPSYRYMDYLQALQHEADDWDMSGVITRFPERMTPDAGPTDYYTIVAEVAKLKRWELREFKRRFVLSMEAARNDRPAGPFRFGANRTDCAFVFIPIERNLSEYRRNGLINLTHACKYDLRMSKCVGVSFVYDKDGWYDVEWLYIEHPWTRNEVLEAELEESNPFLQVRPVSTTKYKFKT